MFSQELTTSRLIQRKGSPKGLDDCVNYVYTKLIPNCRHLPFDLPTEAQLYASGFHRVSGIHSAEVVAVMDYYDPKDRFRMSGREPISSIVAVHMAILHSDDPYLIDHKPGKGVEDIVKTGVDIVEALEDYLPYQSEEAELVEVPSLLFLRRS